MHNPFKPGDTKTFEHIVNETDTARFESGEVHAVYSTFALARDAEWSGRLFVLSIPDWGVTPFAEGRDRAKIAHEIDLYNVANKKIAEAHNCHYVDITDSTREHGHKPEFLAGDGLHPSAKEYAVWAERLVPMVEMALKS